MVYISQVKSEENKRRYDEWLARKAEEKREAAKKQVTPSTHGVLVICTDRFVSVATGGRGRTPQEAA